MGFLFTGVRDLIVSIIDIFAVAVLVFYLYKMAKGTNVTNIVFGVIIVYILWRITAIIGMSMFSWILEKVIDVGVVALIVIFQPEIRQFLQTIGLKQRGTRGYSLWKKLFRSSGDEGGINAAPVVKAVVDMSGSKTGALIVIQRQTDLGTIIETGIPVDAQTSASLLENIFFKNAPLHDGAVVIRENRVVAAKCVLPSTQTRVPKNYGMRHRAALGISEASDAVVIVVSEETGMISIAEGGAIERNISRDAFECKLLDVLSKGDGNGEN